jgi:hypothetical protein
MRLLFALAILAITSSPIESNKRKDYKQHVRRHKDSESTTSSTVAAFSTVAGLDLDSTESIAAAAAAKKSKRKQHRTRRGNMMTNQKMKARKSRLPKVQSREKAKCLLLQGWKGCIQPQASADN